ncbi:MAG: ATP-dependent DNA helicase RecG [Actinobacteria bacterium]|nr:ATP-dependent DNA helicase RecG [Actinomycetota bacterium]
MTAPVRPPLTLRDLRAIPVADLKQVGPRSADRLEGMGIATVGDLLTHYPRRYHDRRNRQEIGALEAGEEATVAGRVQRVAGRRTRNGRAMVEVDVSDGSSSLRCVFFNQAWRERQLPVGTEAAVFGKVEHYRGRVQMTNPVVDVLEEPGAPGAATGVLVPVYPASGKADVQSWQIRKAVGEALDRARVRGFADPLDPALRERLGLVDRTTAIGQIHRPAAFDEVGAATRRLTFDEFLRMQVGLVARKRRDEREGRGLVHRTDGPLVGAFHAALPFPLTAGQRAAFDEILADLAAPAPMHRLLQGEVGSGKTVVACSALLVAVQGGYQGALMAPTEVLAEQHWYTVRALVADLTVPEPGSLLGARPLRIELLTSRTPAAERRRILDALGGGEVDLLIGTHALISEGVAFAALGVAVIDEQHRFGVEQRALLRSGAGTGGTTPDVLVMTATPIPRTAAMLIYGDLDRSELRELPRGRAPIATEVVGADPDARRAVYERVRAEVAAGRQAYVVCPLVEGSAKLEAKAATEEHERLAAGALAGLRIGLLHGQMAGVDKESTMAAFRAGALDVLVATSVIEVGVDVPNATVMVVEDADRFGLLQLHQLRGRIGRGAHASVCFLLADPRTPDGVARMEAMRTTSDGFALAERDLEIRGAGEVFGERQSGWTDLRLGRLPRDEPVVVEARAVAEALLDADPDLRDHAVLRAEVEDLLGDAVEFLFKA